MLTKNKVKHLAVIMDGNRRWAKQRSIASIEGHKAGVLALQKLVALAPSCGIEYLTVYAFSTENWKREKKEVNFLFELLAEVAIKELENLKDKNVKVDFIGDLEVFVGTRMAININKLTEATKANTGLKLQIALNYGSLTELHNAGKQMQATLSSMEIANLTEQQFAKFLYTANTPDPDMVIRTGGEKRLSNFLLWQSANSELEFVDTLWPDFDEGNLEKLGLR